MTSPSDAAAPPGEGRAVSASRLALAAECPRAYRERYVARRPGGPVPDGYRVGTLVHAALHAAATRRIAAGPAWRGAGSEPLDLVAAAEAAAAAEDVPVPAAVVAGAVRVLRALAPRLDLSHAALAEAPWTLDLGDGAAARGVWDRVDLPADPAGAPVVWDYKTGGGVRARADLADDPQVALYLAAARARWPDRAPPAARWWWVERDVVVAVPWSEDQEAGVLAAARALARRTAVRGADEGAWPGAVGPRCGWCPYAVGCPALAAALAAGVDPGAAVPADLEALVAERQRLARLSSVAEDRRRVLDAVLRPVVEARGEVVAAGHRLRLAVRRREDYPDLGATARALLPYVGGEAEDLEAALRPQGADRAAVKAAVGGIGSAEERARAEEALAAVAAPDATAYVEARALRGPF